MVAAFVIAVVLLGDAAQAASEVPGSVTALLDAGVVVAMVADLDVGRLADELAPRSPHAAPLLLTDRWATVLAVVEPFGVQWASGPPSHADIVALQRASELVVERLADLGLAATVAPPAGTAAVTIDLLSSGAASDRLHELLLAHGLTGSRAVADLAADAARDAGIAE